MLRPPIEPNQYTSKGFAMLCAKLGVAQSMGAVGTSADNALAESFNATLKRETLQGAARWESPRAARLAVFRWITRYNTRRRHSYCNYLSPADYYETAHTSDSLQQAAQSQIPCPVSGVKARETSRPGSRACGSVSITVFRPVSISKFPTRANDQRT